MKTNSPTHEEVTQRAQEIWKARGCPDGCDTEIWLEAERKLAENNSRSTQKPPSNLQSRIKEDPLSNVAVADNGHSAPERSFEGTASNVTGTGAKAMQQKKEARAPKLPGKNAPKPTPPESGKPLWDKPHSS